MRPLTQKQPQVKKKLCRVLDDLDDVDVDDITHIDTRETRHHQIATKGNLAASDDFFL